MGAFESRLRCLGIFWNLIMLPRASFGFTIFGHPAEDVPPLARLAETLGFSRISLGEHVVMPTGFTSQYPYGLDDLEHPPIVVPAQEQSDPFVVCAALAAATTDLRIATGVCIVPLYHPLQLARSLATLYRLTDGRFEFGAGVGWLREEYDALGVDFRRRGALLEECLDVLEVGLAGLPFDHAGPAYQFAEVVVTTRPAPVPILLGGTAPPAIRRIARRADGYSFPSDIALDQAQQLRDDIEQRRVAYGKTDRDFRYYARLPRLDPEQVDSYVSAGFVELMLGGNDIWPDPLAPLEDKLMQLRAVARDFGLTARNAD